jgi:hypothetical protein
MFIMLLSPETARGGGAVRPRGVNARRELEVQEKSEKK